MKSSVTVEGSKEAKDAKGVKGCLLEGSLGGAARHDTLGEVKLSSCNGERGVTSRPTLQGSVRAGADLRWKPLLWADLNGDCCDRALLGDLLADEGPVEDVVAVGLTEIVGIVVQR